MAEDPNRELANWELRKFMQTTTDFRVELERELVDFRNAVRAIPGMETELRRMGLALFAVDDKNEFGVQGAMHTLRELDICWKVLRRMVPYFWTAVIGLASLFGTIIGMLYKLVSIGVIKI